MEHPEVHGVPTGSVVGHERRHHVPFTGHYVQQPIKATKSNSNAAATNLRLSELVGHSYPILAHKVARKVLGSMAQEFGP